MTIVIRIMKIVMNRDNIIGLLSLSLLLLISSCIGDDIIQDEVEPELRISNIIDTLGINSEYLFEASYLNNIGQNEDVPIEWTSSDPNIASITSNGLATGEDYGNVTIMATAMTNMGLVETSFPLVVGELTSTSTAISRSGTIRTTSSYRLTGDFDLIAIDEGQLRLIIDENYEASRALPGLYLYLSNNPNSTAEALEIGKVEVFEGGHEYIIDDVGLFDFSQLLYYCKPFNVKVGDGEILD